MTKPPPVDWAAVLAAAHPRKPTDDARARRSIEEAREAFLGIMISPARLHAAKLVQRKIATRAQALLRVLVGDRLSRDYQDVLRVKLRADRMIKALSFSTKLRRGGRRPEHEYLLERLADTWG